MHMFCVITANSNSMLIFNLYIYTSMHTYIRSV